MGKPAWTMPVLREERQRPPRKTTGFTLGNLIGDELQADRAARARRAELDAMGFRPLTGA